MVCHELKVLSVKFNPFEFKKRGRKGKGEKEKEKDGKKKLVLDILTFTEHLNGQLKVKAGNWKSRET